jgi:hypothetical protein
MPAFAVLEPPGHADAAGHPDRFIFLREKFSIGAFVFGPLWMIWQGLWLELVAYLAGLVVVVSALPAIGIGWRAIVVIVVLLQLLLGLEATSLVRWMRVRSGWRDGGVVIADDLDLAERRFFDDRAARRTAARAAAGAAPPAPLPAPPPPPAKAAGSPDIIGLFPEPRSGR